MEEESPENNLPILLESSLTRLGKDNYRYHARYESGSKEYLLLMQKIYKEEHGIVTCLSRHCDFCNETMEFEDLSGQRECSECNLKYDLCPKCIVINTNSCPPDFGHNKF